MKALFHICLREFGRLRKRKSSWVLVLFIPTIVFLYLGSIYQQGSISQIDVAIIDMDKSALSTKLISFLEGSPKINIISTYNSETVLENVFKNDDRIKGIYYIPSGLSKDLIIGRQGVISVFSNSSNIIYGNLLYKEAAQFVNTISAGTSVTRYMLKGVPYDKAMKMAVPIRVQTKALFNPYYNYQYYLIPGLTMVLLQMIVFFLATRSINSELEEHTMNELIESSKGSVFSIIFGKLLCYTIIGLFIGSLIIWGIYPLLAIPSSANTFLFFPVIGLFVLTNAMLGMGVSSIFSNQAIAMDVAFVYNSPAFVFSGFTFPALGMPDFSSWYASLIPYTHFLKAYTKGMTMESDLSLAKPELVALLLFFLFAYLISVMMFHFNLKRAS